MKFESPYLQQGFSTRISRRNLYISLVGMMMTFMFSGLYYGYINSDERLPGLFYHIFFGLSHISLVGVLITFFIGIVFAILMVFVTDDDNVGTNPKLVLYIEFDDNAKLIKIKSRYVAKSDIMEHTASYGELRLRNEEKIRDGLTSFEYSGVDIFKRTEYLGLLLRDHFTWETGKLNTIEKKLKEITQ